MTKAQAQEIERLLDAARTEHEIEDAKPHPVSPPPVLSAEQCAAVDETAGLL